MREGEGFGYGSKQVRAMIITNTLDTYGDKMFPKTFGL